MKIYIGRHSPTAARKKKIEHIKPFVMKPKWEPLERIRDTAKNVPGLYIMAFGKETKSLYQIAGFY